MDDSGLLKAIFASATDYAIIVMNNDGVITIWNAGAELLTGFRQEEVLGKYVDFIFAEEDRAQNMAQKQFSIALSAGRSTNQCWHVRKDASRFLVDSVTSPIFDENGVQSGFLTILCDITEKKRTAEELASRARFDALTGLANRAAFDAKAMEMVANTLRGDHLLVLHMIDLDHFKEINDTLGHRAGDILLRQVAQRMRGITRDTDFIARIGGDEFIVLQSNVHTAEAGGVLAEKILNALSKPLDIEGHEVRCGASIGIAVCPQDAREPEQLIRNADLALYRAKRSGRGGYKCFTEHLDAEAHKKNRDLAELRRAMEESSFWLAYQPKIESRSGQPIALEALLRCNNPMLATYPIGHVIDLAIEAGLMPKIGAWILMEACRQTRKWQAAGLPHIRLCVNLCTRELTDPEIIHQIDTTLDRSGLPPDHLEIEITERQIFDSKEQGVMILKELHSRGATIAIDDFGIGYSSLSYLRRLPVDSLKLDKSFLDSVPFDQQSCAIAKSIINLAHSLNLDVVAEGVESSEQQDFLRRENCQQMQGYFISRPLDAAAMTIWLRDRVSSYPVSIGVH
jgi:diguanylate cyclase (GGDEF)-like protein/PAS domain S-box-containing protein